MATSITKLSGTNFSECKEQVEFFLGLLELDSALHKELLAPLTANSTPEDKKNHLDWDRSNRISIMFMRMLNDTNIKTSLPKTKNAKEYLQASKDRFKAADKSLDGKLMADLVTKKFDASRSMSAHVIEMINFAAKLKDLGLTMDDAFLVQFILTSLPSHYEPFKIRYNTIKKSSLNELTNKLVQEESRQCLKGFKVAHFTQGAGKATGKIITQPINV